MNTSLEIKFHFFAICLCGWNLVSLAHGAPVSLTVQNPSFESPTLADGGTTYGAQVIPSWIQGTTTNTLRNGVQNPVNAQFMGATGGNLPGPAEGAQMAYINNSSLGSFSQALSAVWEKKKTYSFTVALGWKLDVATPGSLLLELRAGSTGGTLVATASTSTVGYVGTQGTFKDFTLYFTTTGKETFIGQPLYLMIKSEGNNQAIVFDNVRVSHDDAPLDHLAVAVAVQNPSFESPALADGGTTYGPEVIPSWILGNTTPTLRNGVQNPQNAQFAGATGGNLPGPAAGAQMAYINNSSMGSFSQALTEVWAAKKMYMFTVALGWRLDVATAGTLLLELRAGSTGGTLVASGMVNTNSYVGTQGTFKDFSISYTTSGTEAFIGQPLYLTIKASGNYAIVFDNVRVLRDDAPPIQLSANVQNHSFEIPVLADGASTNGSQPVSPWILGLTTNLNRNGTNNPLNAQFSGATGGNLPGPAEGKQMAYLDTNYGASFSQVLNETWKENGTYTLTVALGWRLDFATMGSVLLELRAGSTGGTLVASNISPLTHAYVSPQGTFKDYSISYTVNGSEAFIGQPIYISIKTGNGTLLAVDNVRVTYPSYKPVLPVLNWQERSDWINVKTDVTPAAVGDGVADDTAAIQAALTQVSNVPNTVSAVYLPPGTYKITSQLEIVKTRGALVVGHGRDTIIRWGGAAGGTMFRSNGISRSRYVGITWDGNNIANTAIDHNAATTSYYETRIRHQNEQFMNFLQSAIFCGSSSLATAETTIDNCLFYNCGTGISISQFNYYDFTIEGCEFQDCGMGIYCNNGNAYIRDCHFERTTNYDMYIGQHAGSVRRCTSVDSGSFIAAQAGGPYMIQDCRVSGWKSTAYLPSKLPRPSPCAIDLVGAWPATIFDATFVNPPNSNPPILMSHNPVANVVPGIILSNNFSAGSPALVYGYSLNNNGTGNTYTAYDVPNGAYGQSAIKATTSFFRQTAKVPTSILDVKTSYGAIGNGAADDTAAINAAFTAAKALGNNCMVYFPCGTYKVTGELDLTNASNVMVGGNGWTSVINYSGTGPNAIRLRDPNNVTVEHLRVEAPDAKCRILQESTANTASSVRYDGIYMGIYNVSSGTTDRRGLEIRDLPATGKVLMPHIDGDAKFVNCSAGTILANVWYEGVIRLDSSQTTPRTGLIGVQTRLGTLMPLSFFSGTSGRPAVIIEGNDSLIISDNYTESCPTHIWADGSGVTGITGEVTLKGAKMGLDPAYYGNDFLTVNQYRGRIAYFNGRFRYQDPTKFSTGAAYDPVTLIVAGNLFWYDSASATHGMEFNNFNQMLTKLVVLDNFVTESAPSGIITFPDQLPSGSDTDLSGAFDHFRRLGEVDLLLNAPGGP